MACAMRWWPIFTAMVRRHTDRSLGWAYQLVDILLNDTAAESERSRKLCAVAVNALHQAGLFGLWAPTEVGGYDTDLVTQVDVMIEVARADMSACWTLMIGASITSIMAVGLPETGLLEVFNGSKVTY